MCLQAPRLVVMLTGNQQHELCSKAGRTGKKSNDEAGCSLQQLDIFQ